MQRAAGWIQRAISATRSDLARDEALVVGGTSLHVAPDGRVLVAVLEIDTP